MKKLGLAFAFIALLVHGATVLSQSVDERERVRHAVLDYVEGVYQVEPARIERSVHPSLSKQGFWREKGKDGYTTGKMSFDALVEVAKTWNKSGKLPKDANLSEIIVGFFDRERASGEIGTAEELNAELAAYCGENDLPAPDAFTEEHLWLVRQKRGDLFTRWEAVELGGALELSFDPAAPAPYADR